MQSAVTGECLSLSSCLLWVGWWALFQPVAVGFYRAGSNGFGPRYVGLSIFAICIVLDVVVDDDDDRSM